MRKGRSQRKTRGSLPPLSTRPRALSDHGAGPQVVIGLTPGRSEEPASVETLADSRGTEGPVTARSEPSIAKLEVLAEPTLELVREAERLELVHEQSLELVREAHADEDQSALDAIVGTQDAQDAQREPGAQSEQDAQDAQPDFDLVESAAAPAVHAAALTTPGEMSIPPVGDLAVEPIAEQFFSEGELVSSSEPDEEEWDEIRAKAARKSLPEVVQRRARFAKYVRWAVGGAAVVCLAALARTAVTPAVATKAAASHALAAPTAVETTPAAKAATPAVVVEPAKPVEVAPAVTPEPAAPAAAAVAEPAEAKVEAPKVDVPKAEEPKADAPKTEGADATKPAVATSDKTALQEKNDARRLLERGKAADAIAAGERSVALDPTDGEAWLLLGAAYQEKGKNADARRAFTSCVKEGKRGPMGECRAMLR